MLLGGSVGRFSGRSALKHPLQYVILGGVYPLYLGPNLLDVLGGQLYQVTVYLFRGTSSAWCMHRSAEGAGPQIPWINPGTLQTRSKRYFPRSIGAGGF